MIFTQRKFVRHILSLREWSVHFPRFQGTRKWLRANEFCFLWEGICLVPVQRPPRLSRSTAETHRPQVFMTRDPFSSTKTPLSWGFSIAVKTKQDLIGWINNWQFLKLVHGFVESSGISSYNYINLRMKTSLMHRKTHFFDTVYFMFPFLFDWNRGTGLKSQESRSLLCSLPSTN